MRELPNLLNISDRLRERRTKTNLRNYVKCWDKRRTRYIRANRDRKIRKF